MHKKIALAVITSAILIAPAVSSADIISDLQAQIASLLVQLQALRQQMGTPGQQLPSVCGASRNFGFGATGPDVAALQSFLTSQGYSVQDPSGVFANGTALALTAFQTQTGIAAQAGGSGIFGPYTHSYISAHFCITLPTPLPTPTPLLPANVTLSAVPSGGSAPLPVQFNISGNGSYRINYGDQNTNATVTTVNGSISAWHTYTTPGLYTVTVFPILSCDSNGCQQAQAVATTNIVVSSISPLLTINPPVGGSQVVQGQNLTIGWSVLNPPSDSVLQLWLMDTHGNNWGIVQNVYGDALRYTGSVDRNAGISGNLANGTFTWKVPGSNCDANGQNCRFATDGCGPYFTYAGTYYITGKVYEGQQTYGTSGCYLAPSYLGTAVGQQFTIASSTIATSPNLKITSLTGPTSLTTSQSGTWTLNTTVPSGTTQVSYLVTWGDGAVGTTASAQTATLSGTSASATFAHTYGSAATYAPLFTIAAGGAAATSSVSVAVSGTTTPPPPGTTGSLSASPLSGGTPLVVTFGSSATNSGMLDFGDGTTFDQSTSCRLSSWGAFPGCSVSTTHIYGRPGTFTAKLYAAGCGMISSCVIGTATITVGTQTTLTGGSRGSCIYGGNYYTDGQQVSVSQTTSGSGIYQCQSGTWLCVAGKSSDTVSGGTMGGCSPGAQLSAGVDQNSNLASALSALEAALRSLFGHTPQ